MVRARFQNLARAREQGSTKMAMTHYDSRGYEEAASKAADHWRAKFEDWIVGGKQDAERFRSELEAQRPRDFLANTEDLDFSIDNGKLLVINKNDTFCLHRHAVQQMVSRTGILTGGVAEKMMDAQTKGEKWGQELLLMNLRIMFQKTERERVLMRSVPAHEGGRLEVRGFLSDRYRRLDTKPVFERFADTAMNEFGAVPCRIHDHERRFNATYFHDTKVGFSMFLPQVFEPVENEVMIVGLMIQNSDFGAGALTVSMIVIRCWCTNLAISRDELRKVHLGTRLAEDIHFSQETYAADTKTMGLAVRDMVRNLFGPAHVNNYMDTIRRANEEKIDPKKLFAELRAGGHILKGEAEEIGKLFNEPDIQLMPAGQTLWRASNAISLFANKIENERRERAVELREVAGLVIDKAEIKKAA